MKDLINQNILVRDATCIYIQSFVEAKKRLLKNHLEVSFVVKGFEEFQPNYARKSCYAIISHKTSVICSVALITIVIIIFLLGYKL